MVYVAAPCRAILLACALWLPSLATGADNGLVLDFQGAMARVVDVHPSVQEKKNELAAVSNGLSAAKWQRFPAFSAMSSPSYTGYNAPGRSNSMGIISVRLDQPLWTWGKITADVGAAEARVIAAEAGVAEAEQTILVKTATAFSEIMRLRLRLAAAQDNIDEHTRLLELIERRAKNEVNSQNEVMVARSRREQARSESVQFQNSLDNANADLEQLLSLKIAGLATPDVNLDLTKSLSDEVQSAVAFSPVLQRLAAEIQAADSDISSKKAALLPQISARYEQELNRTPYPGVDNKVVYVAITHQLGGGLSSFSSIREAMERRNAADSNRNSTRKDIEDKVRTDWNQKRSSASERAIFKDYVESTRAVYESFVRQFAAGRKTWVEVLNAQREATQARYMLADAIWNGFLAAKRIEIASGKVVTKNAGKGESNDQ